MGFLDTIDILFLGIVEVGIPGKLYEAFTADTKIVLLGDPKVDY